MLGVIQLGDSGCSPQVPSAERKLKARHNGWRTHCAKQRPRVNPEITENTSSWTKWSAISPRRGLVDGGRGRVRQNQCTQYHPFQIHIWIRAPLHLVCQPVSDASSLCIRRMLFYKYPAGLTTKGCITKVTKLELRLWDRETDRMIEGINGLMVFIHFQTISYNKLVLHYVCACSNVSIIIHNACFTSSLKVMIYRLYCRNQGGN